MKMEIMKEIRMKKLPKALFTICDRLDSGKVLDLGCGEGREIEFLQCKGFQCIGIDKNESKIKENKKRCPEVQWICDDFLNYDFHKKFDLIIAKTSIHYYTFEQKKALLKKIKKIQMQKV